MKNHLMNRMRRALTPSRWNVRALLAAVFVVAFAAACDVHGVSEPGALVSLTVTPNATLIVGATQQMVAVGYDAEGRAIAVSPTWSVAAGGGTMASGGMFTAGTTTGLFTNTVVASVGSIRGQASITVTAGPLATITVAPTPVTLAVMATQQFTAVGRDAAGNVVPFTPTWSVVAGGGAISPTGIFTAGGTAGTFTNTVQASNNTLKGYATVIVTLGPLTTMTVTPNPSTLGVGATQQFAVVGKDAGGNTVAFTPVWSVVAGGGAIDNLGLFTAGSTLGSYANTVKATSGTISATATVTVIARALATITVTPNPVSMLVNGTQQFAAIGRDGLGNIFPVVPVWTVVNGGGAIHNATGVFTAGAVAGAFTNTVKATSGLISGTATVNVTAAVASLVDFGIAAPNGIMAGASVTCSGLGVINADISISPGSTMSGFGPCVFTGVTHLGDPTAALAQIALTAAYNTLMGQPCPAANNFGPVDYAGKVLPAGVYCSGSTINVTGALTLNGGGDPNATFVFQSGSATIGAANIILIGSAQAKNIYWVVGSSATLNASAWKGNIIALTTIELKVNTNLTGRALARNGSVTLDATSNVINLP